MDKNRDMGFRYSEKQGKILALLARITIGKRLGIGFEKAGLEKVGLDRVGLDRIRPADFELQLKLPVFDRKQGVFVTLHLDGQLRGCMGSLESDESVRKGVERNAVNAAFNDPRFSALTVAEFARVDVEVSVLSRPEPLFPQTPEAIALELVPARDGVVIQKGTARATFLPQVWEQLPEVSDFLSHLCIKAGLAPDEWTRPGLEFSTYQVQHFS
ncbi:conserved hypothetical protein [Desulforapulum autotrophicum HRM2]|uniref:AMMECR1 domain-containing protein n=1 Tax=Desulforapulum autotrophicum (strain ATCC 43914 / DSM 3382 / VKM B-1955 / HRM2) TaxID=177437 RepID=C0QI62_DESAH|nr:AmmeMemoRadiSam system protein A [Desulforapulum autotrophicum]ACN15798.1 conserved hypothetical protein [Desulforapulum autotrophicum HRM2]